MGIGLKDLFLRHNAQTTDFSLALEISRAEGSYLYRPDGSRILDFISGIGVSNVGHGRPEIVSAVQDQAARYMHLMVYGEMVQQPQVAYAQALIQAFDNHLDSVYFTNSGAEAIEGALKLAKRTTQRTEIVSFENSYHGSTAGALSAMGSEEYKSAYRPLVPGHSILPYNNSSALEAIGPKTAAVLVEPIQSESGYRPGNPQFLAALQAACRRSGALLILDEIQCGFGRSGSLFAYQHYGLQPDILCLGKALGGGMPLGAFAAARSLMHQLAHNPMLGHITTFGGHPVSCAAGNAALHLLQKTIQEPSFAQKSQLLKHLLEQMPHTTGISGTGFLWSVGVGSLDRAIRVQHTALEKGLLTDWFLFESTALRIAPPLTCSDKELRSGAEILADSLRQHPR
jgi:acetylornithine/succinyldiaminopimelate/putrescine aminotransferase